MMNTDIPYLSDKVTLRNGVGLIVAMDRNRGIGLNNQLPWRIKADMQRFKAITTSFPGVNAVLMGRKTFDSIGKPLPNRINYVLTSTPEKFNSSENEAKQLFFVDKDGANRIVESFCGIMRQKGKLWLIGGESVYRDFITYADDIHITFVRGNFETDCKFPEFDFSNWSWRESMLHTTENGIRYVFANFDNYRNSTYPLNKEKSFEEFFDKVCG